MSLRDDLNSVMKQTKDYKEESASKTNKNNDKVKEINEEIKNGKPKEKDPFKSPSSKPSISLDKKKIGIIAGIVIILIVAVFAFSSISKNKEEEVPDWLEEVEEGVGEFEYTDSEIQLLRDNGYTGDEIERFQIEERDAYELAEEAEESRQAKYKSEIQPYLDGKSAKYKQLESYTWLGTGEMDKTILKKNSSYEYYTGSYNCDYTKVPAYGAQLYLKLEIKELKTVAFMNIDADRYIQLSKKGNIVVKIDFHKYDNGSILITDITEKDITE